MKFSYGVYRPEAFVTMTYVEPTFWQRVLAWPGELWWGFLAAIAPTLPIVGAFLGVAVAHALHG